jgi:hypothetical protein
MRKKKRVVKGWALIVKGLNTIAWNEGICGDRQFLIYKTRDEANIENHPSMELVKVKISY